MVPEVERMERERSAEDETLFVLLQTPSVSGDAWLSMTVFRLQYLNTSLWS
jgi:hypothetical protein